MFSRLKQLRMFPLLKRLRRRLGYNEYSAKTVDRLLYSVHVEDLRWIASVCTYSALLVVLMLIIIVVPVFVYDRYHPPGQSEFYKVVVALGIAVSVGLGGVITWCYQTGSARLGMVDLFACEITTLCRICVINDLANSCIRAFKLDVGEDAESVARTIKGARARFSLFDSSEAYTPIFDGNAKELRNLSVKVVTNITAFYTYWKSMRDAFRKLADTDPKKTNFVREAKSNPWPRAMRNVIYMHFLACESARKAIRDLIEFQPNNAENTITILLSELPSYKFLVDNFFEDNDVRYRRLALRESRYREVVPDLLEKYKSQQSQYKDTNTAVKNFPRLGKDDLDELCRDWGKAERMFRDLQDAFDNAMEKPKTRTNARKSVSGSPRSTSGARASFPLVKRRERI